MTSNKFMKLMRSILLISIGIFLAAVGLECFLVPNGYLDGGITGVSLLTFKLTNIPFPLLLFTLNVPFVALGFKSIGKVFALKSILAIAALAIILQTVPFPVLTEDHLLVAAFGGVFIGSGIGFAVRGGAVLDGTEILAIYLSRNSRLSIGDIILIFNIIIFSTAALLISTEIALFAMLTYFIASKAITYIIEGIEEYTSVMIMSDQADELRYAIVKEGYGVTMFEGKKGYGKRIGEELNEMMVVYTVVTRLEISKLQQIIDSVDPNAFVIMSSLRDTKGGMIRKRPMPH